MNITRIGTVATAMFTGVTQACPFSRWLIPDLELFQPKRLEANDKESMTKPTSRAKLLQEVEPLDAGNEESITITTQPYPGSHFHQLKGSVIIRGERQHAEALLLEPKNIQQWFDGLESIKVTEQKDQNHFQLHAQTRAFNLLVVHIPAREVMLNCQKQHDENQKTTRLTMSRMPPEKNQANDQAIYAKAFEGQISIQQKSSQRLEIQFQCHLEPGGTLPAWAVNKATQGSVVKSLRNVCRLLKKE